MTDNLTRFQNPSTQQPATPAAEETPPQQPTRKKNERISPILDDSDDVPLWGPDGPYHVVLDPEQMRQKAIQQSIGSYKKRILEGEKDVSQEYKIPPGCVHAVINDPALLGLIEKRNKALNASHENVSNTEEYSRNLKEFDDCVKDLDMAIKKKAVFLLPEEDKKNPARINMLSDRLESLVETKFYLESEREDIMAHAQGNFMNAIQSIESFVRDESKLPKFKPQLVAAFTALYDAKEKSGKSPEQRAAFHDLFSKTIDRLWSATGDNHGMREMGFRYVAEGALLTAIKEKSIIVSIKNEQAREQSAVKDICEITLPPLPLSLQPKQKQQGLNH